MRRVGLTILSSSLSLLSSLASGAGLLDAYQAAREHDPAFRAARHEQEAGQQAQAIAKAGLLPNVAISSSRTSNRGDRTISGFAAAPLDYRSAQDALVLRQPLFNRENYVRYQQGGVQAEYSDAVFSRKEGELALQVSMAYFDVLLATEKCALADAEVAAFEDQYTLAKRRQGGGEGTITEIAEAESRLRIAEANRVDALNQLSVAKRLLEDMTGRPAGDLQALRKDYQPDGLQPEKLDEWMELAQERSPDILAQRKVYESATLDVSRSQAGHLPRLDLVASVSETENDTVNTINQKIHTRALGLQLNVPLFAGWGVSAQTDQAIANQQRYSAELDAVVNKVLLEVKRQFLAAQAGTGKVAAYRKAVEASQVALEGTRKGMTAGIRTQTDVLDAQRLLFSARRDLAQSRYDFLASKLKLKAAAGVLSRQDVEEVDKLLVAGE